MRSSIQKIFVATLLCCALVSPSLKLRAQDSQQPATRPRRAITPSTQTTQTTSPTQTTQTWPTANDSDPAPIPEIESEPVHITTEPVIRIGLATGARSVTVSTTGASLNATESGERPVPLDVARVRIEPRAYPALLTAPPNQEADRLETASSSTSETPSIPTSSTATVRPGQASQAKARQPHLSPSVETARQPEGSRTSQQSEGSRASRQTEDLRATRQTEDSRRVSPSAISGAKGSVQLTSRAGAATRGEVLYVPGSTKPLLDLRAPIVFAPEDAEAHPVRFNEKPYRGRLEVFANTKGALTVVNVVTLEDYVRGVVPNELSPGGYPELEALKAQAVAARTYAVSNLGRFAAEGFDLTPDTRSQVYGGRSTEHPLTDRAVLETRGRIATYKGVPINALYTSTCGGRTEDAEHIFGGASVPYLRGRECALEAGSHFAHTNIRTTREPPSIKSEEHSTSARDAALLSVHGFSLPARVGDEWLAASVTIEELRELIGRVAALARQPAPFITAETPRPGGFATALASALDGESRGAVLLNSADVEYLLAFHDAADIPQQNRADVAAMLREGHLSLFPDGTLRARQPLSRSRVLRALAHALEARGLLRLQKATARTGPDGTLLLRPASGKDLSVAFAPEAYLFRAFGEGLYPAREIELVGGESLTYHTGARGEIDYLEARPATNGAASDHVSPFANWSETLTPSGVLSRLSRSIPEVGSLLDVRVQRRGVS
ncbi:MAG: stage sporulation protein, partial [Acidobacteriota bacterium]|nr:stage sporulation protein [Acidobacteriota bacterium]